MNFEHSNGYKIIRAIGFDNGYGFVFGIDYEAVFTFSTWQYAEQGNKNVLYSGIFFTEENLDTAKLNFQYRVRDYIEVNPGIAEKYNYSIPTETSVEGVLDIYP